MPRYIQNANGQMAGSIGEGRDTIPAASQLLRRVADHLDAGGDAPGLAAALAALAPFQGNTVTTDADGTHVLQTSATRHLPPTTLEQDQARQMTRDWFRALDSGEEPAVAVWRNDRTGVWQVVESDGVEAVWAGRSFDYCRQVTSTPTDLSFHLESGTVLTATRIDGVDPAALADAFTAMGSTDAAGRDAAVELLRSGATASDQQHLAHAMNQPGFAERLRAAIDEVLAEAPTCQACWCPPSVCECGGDELDVLPGTTD